MVKSMHEVFLDVASAKTRRDKIAVLKANKSPTLINTLKAAFDVSYEWDLPEGCPPLDRQDRTLPLGISDSTLYVESRRFYIFDKKYQKIKRTKKEMLFVALLEGLHYTEADMLVALKDKTLNQRYNGLTPTVAHDAFPQDVIIK